MASQGDEPAGKARYKPVEKWLVHTDPFGNVTVGIIDKNGKVLPNPQGASKILGGLK